MHMEPSKPEDSPARYEAATLPGDAAGAGRLRLHGPDAHGFPTTRDYPLPGPAHADFLDLFEAIARDFGTRVPLNRRPRPAPDFDAPYEALLTENAGVGVLHGYGDPAVARVVHDGVPHWMLFVTSNDAPDAFPILRSGDLRKWEHVGFVFPRGRKPAWAADGEGTSDFWAPELHRVGGAWRVYFSARQRDGGELAIGVATAARPEGPYVVPDRPLLAGGVIDSHVLVAPDGIAFLMWKEDRNGLWPERLAHLLHDRPALADALFTDEADRRTAALVGALWPWMHTLPPMQAFQAQQPLIEAAIGDFAAFRARLEALPDRAMAQPLLDALRTPVYAQPLSPDGLSLVGERQVVLENDRDWEGHLIEGVWVVPHAGRYYLFYAANDFSTEHYGIGVAIADAPLGPYRKVGDGPLLRSTAQWAGPGHPSVAPGLEGEQRLFLHAFFPGTAGYNVFRALLSVRIEFLPDRVALLDLPLPG